MAEESSFVCRQLKAGKFEEKRLLKSGQRFSVGEKNSVTMESNPFSGRYERSLVLVSRTAACAGRAGVGEGRV